MIGNTVPELQGSVFAAKAEVRDRSAYDCNVSILLKKSVFEGDMQTLRKT